MISKSPRCLELDAQLHHSKRKCTCCLSQQEAACHNALSWLADLQQGSINPQGMQRQTGSL